VNDYFAALLFFLPAGISNMSPVLAKYIPLLKQWRTPMDFGIEYDGHRLLGANKTWRGIIFGTLMGGLTAVIVSKLNINTVAAVSPFIVGCLLGFGALAGDAIESLFKRRRGVKPGESWFPFDQIDYIIGALALVSLFVSLPLWAVVTIFAVYFLLHLLVVFLAFKLGIKDKPI
jgi:CDP-2,3-bis-(O-geranylgeranyl)-sn-glycerol synthase